MYRGSFILKFISVWSSWTKHGDRQIDVSFHGIKSGLQNLINWIVSAVYKQPHLNHLLEFYMQQNSSLLKASMVVGMFDPFDPL
uniref:Uncharacterized protein n=1 Tax=Helianthus annuus TaxID=4232 RepID=A0A251TPK9_HELAN